MTLQIAAVSSFVSSEGPCWYWHTSFDAHRYGSFSCMSPCYSNAQVDTMIDGMSLGMVGNAQISQGSVVWYLTGPVPFESNSQVHGFGSFETINWSYLNRRIRLNRFPSDCIARFENWRRILQILTETWTSWLSHINNVDIRARLCETALRERILRWYGSTPQRHFIQLRAGTPPILSTVCNYCREQQRQNEFHDIQTLHWNLS